MWESREFNQTRRRQSRGRGYDRLSIFNIVDRTSASNGSQTLTAIARDAAGKRTKSTTVTMTVANNQTAVASGSSTTPGTLSLSSTFDAISVRSYVLE